MEVEGEVKMGVKGEKQFGVYTFIQYRLQIKWERR